MSNYPEFKPKYVLATIILAAVMFGLVYLMFVCTPVFIIGIIIIPWLIAALANGASL